MLNWHDSRNIQTSLEIEVSIVLIRKKKKKKENDVDRMCRGKKSNKTIKYLAE
jgi:hypothetical protein